MQRFHEVFVLSLLACLRLSGGSACISGNSLATYETLGSTGCYVGPLLVEDFIFSVVSTSGGATPVADTSITVTTQSLGDTYGLAFGSSGFNVNSGQSVSYLIGFTWDPSGDIRNASDILDPGAADILTDLCVGAAFSGVSCSGIPLTLHVFQPSQLLDSVSFSPVSVVGVRDNISLDGSGGSASFESIENDVTVPEPAAGVLAAGGLLGWFALRGRRRKAAQVVLQSR